MIFLFRFLLKEGCVLLILQTNGGEVEAQKSLLCSPERVTVFVVRCGKSPRVSAALSGCAEVICAGTRGSSKISVSGKEKEPWPRIKALRLPFISKTSPASSLHLYPTMKEIREHPLSLTQTRHPSWSLCSSQHPSPCHLPCPRGWPNYP